MNRLVKAGIPVLLLLTLILVSVSTIEAQTDLLGRQWTVNEGNSRAVWTRRGNTNTFDGVWQAGGQRITGTLTMMVRGNHLTIQRMQSSDNCQYQYTGTISGGKAVSGTVRNLKTGQVQRWNATIATSSSSNMTQPGKPATPGLNKATGK